MNTVDVAQIKDDLERLRAALAQMVDEKTKIDTAIVQQRGAINYAELLLERAQKQVEVVETEEAPPLAAAVSVASGASSNG